MRRLFLFLHDARARGVEIGGAVLVGLGLYEIYVPAALVFAGAVLVFVAQGMERDE